MGTVKITADTIIRGVPAFAGDVVSVDDADARLLIQCEKAVPYAEDAPAVKGADEEETDKHEKTKRRTK